MTKMRRLLVLGLALVAAMATTAVGPLVYAHSQPGQARVQTAPEV